uniref:WRKY transcription factor 20 n=1 Tax=Camellia sinensis TaxID=4442 RepID=A0A385NHS8_CAMSI|nr:WRKY transcription factor 20 [Camellia sinensis]
MGSDKSQKRKNPDSTSQSNQEGNNLSVLPKQELGELQKSQSPNAEVSVSQCNEEGKTEKVLENLQKRQSTDSTSRVRTSHSLIPEKVSDNLQQKQSPDTGVCDSQPNQEKISLSTIPEKVPDSLQFTLSINTGSHRLQRDQEGRTPPRIPDKALGDGYNWRKYGQKLVKGNEFVRSYYRCTHPNCPAKRQVERSQDGQITDTVYLGKHDHPKPQPGPPIAIGFVPPIQAKRQEERPLATVEDKTSNAHGLKSHHAKPMETARLPTNAVTDDAVESAISQRNRTREESDHRGDVDSKRQKRDICSIDETLVDKPHGEPRVVQTRSEVDFVNDGYRWRKYGQKMVKGNSNPRSYYRCSNGGCPVKKHVERASHDPKMVITTYEGQHDHDIPLARTVTPNTAGTNTNITALNGESRSTPEEKNTVGLEVAVHISAN